MSEELSKKIEELEKLVRTLSDRVDALEDKHLPQPQAPQTPPMPWTSPFDMRPAPPRQYEPIRIDQWPFQNPPNNTGTRPNYLDQNYTVSDSIGEPSDRD